MMLLPTPPPVHRRRRAEAASSLISTMLVVAAMLSFLSIAALMTSQYGRFAGRQQGASDTMLAADSALEYGYAAWVAATNVNRGTPPSLATLTTITATAFLSAHPEFSTTGPTGVNVRMLKVTRVNPDGGTYTPPPQTVPPTPDVGVATQNVPGYPGWAGSTLYYKAEVDVINTAHYGLNIQSPAEVHAARYFQLTLVPLFQAAIFYEGNLELNPGADMIVKGLVHSNQSIWAQGLPTSSTPVLLQFKSNVSYVGTFNEVANPAATKGWDGYGYGMFPPAWEKNTWSDGQLSGASATQASQVNKVSTIDPFGGASQNNNGLHDMIEVPPVINNNSQIAYDQASLRVTIDSSKTPGPITALDANGAIVAKGGSAYTVTDGRTTINSPTPTQNLYASIVLTPTDLANVNAALTIGGSMYDQREGTTVKVTSLDVTGLLAATNPPSAGATALQATFNGALYIHDVSTATKNGIRLKNGSTIVAPNRAVPNNVSKGLTVASDNGVYVQGDLNTGGTNGAVPSNVANTDGTAVHVAAGYTEAPVAILADAVTILSNNWNDSNASATLSSRTATPTTVNAAILAGDVPTNFNGNGTASGGAHNFPRFLENWNNINFTYWGSLVEAYNSEKFTGAWQTNQVYYWPNRKWNFDSTLVTHPPPFSPQGVLYSRGRWDRESGPVTPN